MNADGEILRADPLSNSYELYELQRRLQIDAKRTCSQAIPSLRSLRRTSVLLAPGTSRRIARIRSAIC
jgi:hypothetical protein